MVVGPTASGKTELAVRLAEELGGEVVSADSVQVYRRFDVGTGKPTADQLARAPHHLVGIVDPLEAMDAARWAARADGVIADLRRRGRRAIVCGGTFLWIRALLHGLAEAPPADEAIRRRHRHLAQTEGREALHGRLVEVDPITAGKLSPNDLVRVSRALEVHELTGRPLSELQARHAFGRDRYRAELVGIARERDELAERIRRRVSSMLDAGWVDEVRALLADGLGRARAMRSVGYRQIAEALEAGGRVDEAELRDGIARATRVFARRQRTWLRDQPVRWLDPTAARTWRPDAPRNA